MVAGGASLTSRHAPRTHPAQSYRTHSAALSQVGENPFGARAVTIHYHGTPITPKRLLLEMAGSNFCVSHAAPAQVKECHELGQSVMLDNGAFSVWKRGHQPNWNAYYEWCDRWLDYPTTWAVIPDVIEGDAAANDLLLREWPHSDYGAPVYHMHEPISRLLDLVGGWSRVCIGSSGEYADVLSDKWQRRMDEAWREVARVYGRTPYIHMLRGMQLVLERWPFASVDSTDIARNHNRKGGKVAAMRARWDAGQCPPRFIDPGEQLEIAA
jgi:hypothetical protein